MAFIRVPVVNAFVADGRGGNPAGVVLDAPSLSSEQMQRIARKVGAPATAFILPDDHTTHRLRFFTPTIEGSLCGHATIASWSYMHNHGLHGSGTHTQQTLAGLINISVDDDGFVLMEQPEQTFGRFVEFPVISQALHIPESSFDKKFRPRIVRDNLLFGLKSKDLLNGLKLNMEQIIELGNDCGFSCLHIFVMLENDAAIAAVRNFAPAEGIDEEAGTGTTNGSFLAYLKSCDALSGHGIYKIDQGELLGRPSHIFGTFRNDRVWIGGKAAEGKQLQVQF